jgi:hypothetical protein
MYGLFVINKKSWIIDIDNNCMAERLKLLKRFIWLYVLRHQLL